MMNPDSAKNTVTPAAPFTFAPKWRAITGTTAIARKPSSSGIRLPSGWDPRLTRPSSGFIGLHRRSLLENMRARAIWVGPTQHGEQHEPEVLQRFDTAHTERLMVATRYF